MLNRRLPGLTPVLLLVFLTLIPPITGCGGSGTTTTVILRAPEVPDEWLPDGYLDGTDKWHIDFDNEALYQAMDTMGFPPDRADEFKSKTVKYVRKFFYGQCISFDLVPPEDGSTPAPGWSDYAVGIGVNPYNTIAVWNGETTYVIGRAYRDNEGNARVENNSGTWMEDGECKLGVFIDAFAQGIPYEWGFDECAKWVGMICAHEIGHSLGLRHINTYGNIMSTYFEMALLNPAFVSEHWNYLLETLPGPGR
ncbi:MAG: matrixin family metalloprotease [Planctomycetota bacterium]|nr:MAG: matrixin family metalloprotease [Planctomycetota bacterium]